MGTVRLVMLFDSPLERVYASWRDAERLSRAFDFIESIEFAHNVVTLTYRGFAGKGRTLRLVVTEEVKERCLAWREEESNRGVSGSLAFDARGSQTYVTFVLAWRPPFGRIGDFVGDWVGFPMNPLREGLARFEQIAKEPL